MEAARKWLAIRSYRNGLRTMLRERYGAGPRYTPAQVLRTIDAGGFSANYACYAICMYCGREAFEAHHLATGERCDYESMAQELSEKLGSGGSSGSDGYESDSLDGTSDGTGSGEGGSD